MVIVAIIAGFLVEVARGHDGNPFTWLGAAARLSYLAAVIAMRAGWLIPRRGGGSAPGCGR